MKEITTDNIHVEKTYTFTDSLPFDSTSSLARDVWEGKPSEIEYQNGTVVKLTNDLTGFIMIKPQGILSETS